MRHIKRPSQSFSHSVLHLGAVNKKSIGNMQALGLFSRRAILGRSNKSSVVLEKIAKENSLNRIGAVNFNKYGKQDGIGFLPCSDKFVDSFLLYVYVPDYFVTARKTYTEVGVVSMRIRTLLKRHGLQKCKVKVLSPLKEVVKPKDLEKVYGRCKSRETYKTVYYVQEFRVTCEDEDYSAVLEFLRTDEYKIRNILIKDIQLSTDYAGSFNKEEVIHYLMTNEGFRMQGHADRTILDNTDQVGNNCLTYMESLDGLTTCCTIYNKMVQMLESKGVGQSWNDWVCQKDTRLAKSRDLCTYRGLTHVEVALSFEKYFSSDRVIENCFNRITQTVSPCLVYSTPFADVWRAYCDALLHSLVVVDRTRKIALIVCTYNEITKNVSGQFLYGWSGNEIHHLVNDTFGSELPVDIIEVCDCSKARSGKTKDTLVNITGARYFKRPIYTDFPTYLISNGCWYEQSKEKEHLQQLEKAGFVPHKNCTPRFAYLREDGVNRQGEIKLVRTDILRVKVPGRQRRATKKEQSEQTKDVKPVEHKGQKRKLVITNDGTVSKFKRS